MYISEIRTSAPTDERMPLERKMYDTPGQAKDTIRAGGQDPAGLPWKNAQAIE